MPVAEIGESERKAVWEKENELRFRDGELGSQWAAWMERSAGI